MSLRIAILGPGRVGSAIAWRLRRRGVDVLGLLGRSRERTEAAVRWSGAGRVLDWPDLAAAHVVVFAVGDPDLPDAVGTAVAHGLHRRPALWLHTSGRHGLTVFDAARSRAVRRGALHPVAPFADAAAGAAAMVGAPALCEAEPRGRRLVQRLATWLDLAPVFTTGIHRARYHAACALAANGTTALRGVVDAAFASAGALPAGATRVLADALMGAALLGASERGAAAALSGPVRRGDAGTVRLHLEALAAGAPSAVGVYRALMEQALALAADLPAAQAAAVRAALAGRPEADR